MSCQTMHMPWRIAPSIQAPFSGRLFLAIMYKYDVIDKTEVHIIAANQYYRKWVNVMCR